MCYPCSLIPRPYVLPMQSHSQAICATHAALQYCKQQGIRNEAISFIPGYLEFRSDAVIPTEPLAEDKQSKV